MKKIFTILAGLALSMLLVSEEAKPQAKNLIYIKQEMIKTVDNNEALLVAKKNASTSKSSEKSTHYQSGIASYYGKGLNGSKTASGERHSRHEMVAAHRTLPFGTRVRVTNLNNGKEVVVRINDRGPFVKGRVIDLSYGAFSKIENPGKGLTRVKLEVLGSSK